ncbi:MAG: hypothetical protein JW863_23050 [Chitinispirillaceae bacterium]|nr:hypothetical protein [Chitinispirillaceae bacterium]
MITLRVLVFSCMVVALRCSSPTTVGNGTGTDAGEARIFGTVRLPGDNAGGNVSVTLRKQDYIPFSISSSDQVTTTSGKNGNFTLSTAARGYYLVELSNNDSLRAVKRFRISGEDTAVNLGDLLLDTSVTFSGKVLTDGTPASGGHLLAMGLDISGTVAGDGSFSVRLPAREQLFRIMTENGQPAGDALYRKNDGIDTIRTTSVPATVLDDFENRDGFNSLTPLLGGGSWFAYTDTADGGNSTILPTEDPGLVAAIDSTSDAYRGSSLHCTFNIDLSFSAPYALIGVDISGSKDADVKRSWFDLTGMTALSFMAKGTGTVIVQFTCKPIGTSTDFLVFELPVTLSPAWSRQTITPAEIPLDRASTVTWQSGCVAVSNINFVATNTTELWLDDLTLEGMNVTDFLK